MKIRITAPSMIRTCVELPASKSISNRALIIDALGKGMSQLRNLSDCDDTQVMIKALKESSSTIDILAAGTAMRFLTAYLCVTPGEKLITGTERMKQRPVSILVNALRELGADIRYVGKEGFPPLCITGKKLSGKELILNGSVSSQYISALLMIAPILEKGLSLHLTGEIISRPYINLTCYLMKEFGVNAEWITERMLRVKPQVYQPTSFTVESDWSAASYWYQIAALAPNATIELKGLFAHSLQGDSQVTEIFANLGVRTIFTDQGVRLHTSRNCTDKLEYNLINQPDLAQTLAVTCSIKGIPFCLSGLQSLRIKETDRIAALITELGKLGYVLQAKDNSVLCWDGQRKEAMPHPAIDTYQDHRMAMAFAPACIVLPEIRINHPEVVSKSYSSFWKHLRLAGFQIHRDI